MITALDKKTALVLIDLQKGIVSFATAKPASEILEQAAKLVAAFRSANLPVVVVNVDPRTNPLNNARKDAKNPGSAFTDDLLEIVPEIITLPGDIFITKNTWNAFSNPSLHTTLQERGITGIVLAGISTSIGIEGTARAASERGYNITFAKDAMTDMVADAHENSITRIFPRLGEVGTADEVIDKLATL